MSDEEYKIIRVTMTKDFYLPHYMYKAFEDELQGLWEDWFLRFESSSHAARDSCQIGNSQKYLKFEELSLGKLQEEAQERERRRMYPLQEKIKADMIAAMKAKETEKRDTLKLVISEMQRQPTKDVEDHTVVKILNSMIKGAKETMEMVEVNPEDVEFIKLLESYLPEQVSEYEIMTWIAGNIDFSQFKNKMQAMKPIMDHFGTTAKGDVVKQILNSIDE